MKVLRIISVGYVAGGAENGIVKMDPYLRRKGYHIKTLASDLASDEQHFNDYTFKSVKPTSPLKLLLFLFNPSSFFALKKVLKEYKPDIVHLHTMTQVTPSVLFLLKRYPTVMTLHGPETFLSKLSIWCIQPSYLKNDFYDKKSLNMTGKIIHFYFNYIQKIIYKFVLNNVDIFIAPSTYIQSVAKVDVSPIIHLPNFTELGNFHELKNDYQLLFVGRLEKVKGIEFLIKAIPLIIKAFPQTRLTIVGDGLDKTNLLNLTEKLHIGKHVQFLGWVGNKDIDSYYAKASITIIPSVWPEIFGKVTIEAMSVGRPVIGTNVGGIPEIIDDGINGYLVEPQNSEQIAEKVIQLFSDEKLLKNLGNNARKKAEGFGIEKYVESIEKVYTEMLDKYRSRNHSKS